MLDVKINKIFKKLNNKLKRTIKIMRLNKIKRNSKYPF